MSQLLPRARLCTLLASPARRAAGASEMLRQSDEFLRRVLGL